MLHHEMLWRVLADAVLLLHAGFVLGVALGGFAVLRWPRLAWVHAPAALWGAALELSGWTCPLTPLESRLRTWGGDAGYPGGFVEHWVEALVYPPGLTRGAQVALGIVVLGVNAALYVWTVVRARCRASRQRAAQGTGGAASLR